MLSLAYFEFETLYRHFVQSTRLKKDLMAPQQIPQHQQYANQPSKLYYELFLYNLKAF